MLNKYLQSFLDEFWLNQKEFAQLVGTTIYSVSKWCSNDNPNIPRMSNWNKIAEVISTYRGLDLDVVLIEMHCAFREVA